MENTDYDDMRFLIVDNLKPSQDILKQFAMRLTSKQVDSTHYAQDVITICQQKSYDVILLGYDLGEDQKNGQQILEELRVNNFINRHCIIILITAEISQAMVLAALEHKPDNYLCKPYSLNELNNRLLSCIRKKKSMAAIYHALEQGKPTLVIERCDDALAQSTPYKAECLGIKSRQLFQLEKYDQAQAIYLSYKDNKSCQWANIGLGRIALQKEQLDHAEAIFKQAILINPYYLASYDWLALTYQKKLQFLFAEEILEQALSLSPRSLPRLKRYAQLCLQNEHFDKATYAYEQTYILAHNSIHHSPDNAISFAKALIEYVPILPALDAKKMSTKAFKYLKQMSRDFNRAEFRIQSHLLTACLLEQTNEARLAQEALDNGAKLLTRERDNLSSDSLLKITEVMKKIPSANNKYSELLIINKESDANDYNDKAQAALEKSISLYHSKKFSAAIEELTKALNSFPEHLGIKLNLLQVYLMAYEESEVENTLLMSAKILLKELSTIDFSEDEKLRLRKLQRKYQALAGI
ncbi:response regulator [Colwellia sp. D2M02]|uniref:response regulator n=1 Tax=Colwellia sp. D2M02 TaxID=2841562 RepID=UPI001C08BBC5|nr:response regulator [Colwellia sp. D2M02]MBU2892470.1 response regulator [Colwellia sp. D2M02]